MLNIVYLVLLSDINLLFGAIGLCLAPYYLRITNIRLDFSLFSAVFLFAIALSFVVFILYNKILAASFIRYLRILLVCIFANTAT